VSADTTRNADAVSPPRAGHEQAAEPDRAQSAERAPGQQPADAGRSPHPAQPLNRAEHNAARHAEPPIRGARNGEGKLAAGEHNPDAQPVITHYHADFKGSRTDPYTDGTRWAPGDVARERATAGRGELPDDSPTGEDLIDSAGEEGSLTERLRRELYDEGDEISDVIEHGANRGYELFAPPPNQQL
jgi:hypothetical protein